MLNHDKGMGGRELEPTKAVEFLKRLLSSELHAPNAELFRRHQVALSLPTLQHNANREGSNEESKGQESP